MSTEWKPGDVAMVSLYDGKEVRAIRVARCPMCTHLGNVPHWHCGGENGGNLPSAKDSDARPLVVIDPEDREQVERLMRDLWQHGKRTWEETDNAIKGRLVEALTDALREFANPKPPRPEEPTGLGAVVEDAMGLRWVRDHDGYWSSEDGTNLWPNLNVVRVLSEGVQP